MNRRVFDVEEEIARQNAASGVAEGGFPKVQSSTSQTDKTKPKPLTLAELTSLPTAWGPSDEELTRRQAARMTRSQAVGAARKEANSILAAFDEESKRA